MNCKDCGKLVRATKRVNREQCDYCERHARDKDVPKKVTER